MKLIDINHKHGLALVQDAIGGGNTRYVPASEAPSSLAETVTKQVYLGQLHYIASHQVAGLYVNDRLIDGKRPPKDGWERWKPAVAP